VQQLQQNKANVPASVQINQNSQLDSFQIETATELFRNLIMTMDTEGRYLVLNAIANQLRYPNSHTHYFSFIILYLFAEASQVIDPTGPLVKLGYSILHAHNLVLMKLAYTGNCPGADNKGSFRKTNCQPPTSLGITDYVH
jgi:hypothetical protein